MGHPLRRFKIEGYKSIRVADVELRAINILIGANGAGKSNFVSAFGLLNDLVNRNLGVHVARRGGANALLRFGRKATPEMSFHLDFFPNGYDVKLSPTAEDALYFSEESCWFHNTAYPKPYDDSLGAGHFESKLASSTGIAAHVVESIQSWRVFHFHDTSDAAPVKQTHQLDDNSSLRQDASNLAAYLYRIRESGFRPNGPLGQLAAPPYVAAYKQIVGAIRSVAPFFDDFVLEPDRMRPDVIRLAWKERGNDAYFGAGALSDGTLRFICLATLLLQPAFALPKSVIIDEPELGLHPFAIQKLAAMIKAAATQTQVIVSTQSVTLMNQFAPADVIVVDREEQGSTFRRVTEAEVATWADNYALGELWEKNLIGGRPR